ncbi:MAG: hypothetical protein LBS53_12500, partial [Synergistaceae bacterium]|nr:hypothetical protein [Synergistaceae bacterium]
CEIVKEYTDITDPSDFDAFQSAFGHILDKIHTESPESDILLNVTSGSPQMQTTLCVEFVSSNIKLIPVQVKTPAKTSGANVGYYDPNTEGLESCFKNNLDNHYPEMEGVEDRCSIPLMDVLRKAVIRNQIKSLIDNYDYQHAFKLARDNSEFIKDKARDLLGHVYYRSKLADSEARELAKQLRIHEDLYPITNTAAKSACEYYLVLKMKILRGELSDALFRLFPLAECLAEKYIEQCYRAPYGTKLLRGLNTIARKRDRGNWVLETEKAESNFGGIVKHLDNCYIEKNGYGYVAWSDINLETMIYIMAFKERKSVFVSKLSNGEFIDKFQKLQNFKSLRNESAHSMKEVGKQDFEEVEKANKEKLFQTVETLIRKIFKININCGIFDIYDSINGRIKDALG